MFGFSLLTLKQFFGTLYHYNREMKDKGLNASRIPTFFIFVASYIFVLSSVDHKERRFYAPITQLACMCQAYGFIQLFTFVRVLQNNNLPITAKIFGKLIMYAAICIHVRDANDYVTSFFFFGGVSNTMLEPNLIFSGKSPHLYKNGDMSDPNNF